MSQSLMQKTAQIGTLDIFIGAWSLCRLQLLTKLRFVTIFGAAVRLFAAEPVDRPPSCQCHHPGEQFAGFRRIVIRLAPDLQKNILQNVVCLAFLLHDVANDGLEAAAVPRVKFRERLRPAAGDCLHQSFVGSFRNALDVDMRLEHVEEHEHARTGEQSASKPVVL